LRICARDGGKACPSFDLDNKGGEFLMQLKEMTWPEVKALAGKTVAVLPLAAIEQHGPHLSVSTDNSIVNALGRRVEAGMPSDIVLCPSLPYGSSHHHLAFPGTVSLPPDLFSRVVVELVQSLLKGGFRRIVLLNGHGGNITPARQALSILSHEWDEPLQPNIALVTYWELAGKAFAGEAPMESPALSHACEYETSLMLHLYPERVRMPQSQRARRPPSNQYIPWEDDEPYRGVTLFKKTQYLSSNGSSGEPQKGTVAKGEKLFEQAVAALRRFLSEFKGWPFMEDLRNE
jgi:creatinine amidohydrolase